MAAAQYSYTLSDQIKVSAEAQSQLAALVDNEDEIMGVRIFVTGGGCSGMTYGMTFVEQSNERDAVLETGGVKIFVDPVALSFLEGVEIDYQTQGLNKSFVFKNVFAATGGSGACGGCGGAGH